MLISEEYDHNSKSSDFLHRSFIVSLTDREEAISHLIALFITISILRVLWLSEHGLSKSETEWIFLFYKSIYSTVSDKTVCNSCSIIIYIIQALMFFCFPNENVIFRMRIMSSWSVTFIYKLAKQNLWRINRQLDASRCQLSWHKISEN